MRRAFFIWNIPNTEKGDPLLIAAAAVSAGLTDAFIKVADGTVNFGIYSGKDMVPAVVTALKAVGVRVWGWQYCYGTNPVGEEKVATRRIKELGLDGFIVDAEMEFKQVGWAAKAETYLSLLRQHNPSLILAFSSFRFPHYHPEFPWAVFYKYCDINMPQIYWLLAHNAAQQTQVSFEKFRAMGNLPIMPVGPAWKEQGWRPTLAEIQDFERVSASFGAELVSYWSWEHCRRDLPELWPTKPIVIVPPVQNDRLGLIEKKVIDLERVLFGLSQFVTDLKAILK